MSVRVTALRHPRHRGRVDEPYEQTMNFETVYQLEDRLIGVGGETGKLRSKQLTRSHVVSVDFETVDLIPYSQMVDELPGERETIPDDSVSVERLR